MTKRKYEKLIFSEPIVDGEFAPKIGLKDVPGLNIRIAYNCVSKPFLMINKAHKHDHDQYLVFIGGDPTNIKDFGGEAELSLGEEEEKYVINKTTIIYVPAGLVHCPLNFTRVEKPIIFMDIYPAAEYEQKQVNQHPKLNTQNL
jgi:mannose-6-phosphate isomerase-like protein (cupin superfamily)